MPTKTQSLIRRSPVVAVMGHIDHGKSTLLDYIRKTNIVDKEFGGITQHISAYEVIHDREDGASQKITFLDTPGHEAFQNMRARGAAVADVAVLVVSAEDGVRPQTVEAYKAIVEANIPFIVAINKIDKPNANVEKTKQSLAENNIFIEGYGGDVPAVSISAKKGDNVGALLDLIILSSDLADLSGDTEKDAEGVVIESSMDQKRGAAATLIIKNGTLRGGEYVVAGESIAPLRMIEDFLGNKLETATFSSPISITGWNKAPLVGSPFKTYKNKKDAETAALSARDHKPAETAALNEEALVVPIIIKTDVAGTAEAIKYEIQKIKNEKLFLKVLRADAGTIGEGDVKTALGFPGAIIIGFNVKVDPRAQDLADRNSIIIQTFNVIYKMSEWLLETVTTRTPKSAIEEMIGAVKILKVFSQNKDKQVVGGKIVEGKIAVDSKIRIMRRENNVGAGEILEVQQSRSKVSVATDGECGLLINSKITIAPGDILQSVITVEK